MAGDARWFGVNRSETADILEQSLELRQSGKKNIQWAEILQSEMFLMHKELWEIIL